MLWSRVRAKLRVVELRPLLRICCALILAAGVACSSYNLESHLSNPGGMNNAQGGAVRKYGIFVSLNSIQIASGSTWTAAGGSTIGSCGSAGSQLAIADCACSYWASAAGLGTAFRAWISDSANDAICRIAGVNGVNCTLSGTTGPYYNYAGGANGNQRQLLFNSLADIAGSVPAANPVSYQEDGIAAVGGTTVITGTLTNGRVEPGGHCTDWSAGGANTYRVGDPAGTTTWTQAGTGACSASTGRLYCVEY